MAQYAIDRVISVAGTYAADNSAKDITKGNIAFLADQVTDPSLSFTSETEDIVDARNNVVMTLQGARGATFGASNAFFNTSILAAQTGGKLKAITGETFEKFDILTADSTKAVTLTATPSATSPEASDFKIYKLEDDGSLSTAAAIATGVTVASGKITITSANEGEKYLVIYDAKVTSGEHIVASSDASNELLDVTAEVLFRELCSEALYYGFIVIRGKLSGEVDWSMTRDGNHPFEITAVPSYCGEDKRLVEVIIVSGENLK